MKRANDVIVGATILGGAILIIAATLWVKQSDVGRDRREVAARFRDVGNAQVGNSAVIRGVRAGRIQSMELLPDGWVRVRMILERDAKLPADPVVLLNESSLFGEWQATILERSALPGDREVRLAIQEASGGASGDLPGATLPDIAKLTAVAGRIAGDVASVAERVEVAFDDSAARELRGSIKSVAELSSTLATAVRRQSRSVDALVADVHTGIGSLNRAASAAERVAERAQTSTEKGEIRQIIGDVSHAATQLRTAADELRTLSGRVVATQGKVDQILVRSDSIFQKLNDGRGTFGLMLNDPSLYHHSDSLVQQLRELVGDVRKNPKRYINVKVF
jgi:phospholipid/cholesterol/gamma-HCH transport system substrate-binding protein